MTIKHNFYVFFGVLYFGLLAAGLSAGLALGNLTGLNAGFLINIVCFCAAAQLSTTRFGGRFLYVDGPSSLGLRATVRQKAYFIAAAFAIMGVSIDMVYYTLGSFYFKGEFQAFNYWRLPLMFAVYGVLSYFMITNFGADKKKRG